MTMPQPRCVVLAHVYHIDVWPELTSYLHALDPFKPDLYVNHVETRAPEEWPEDVRRDFAPARVFLSPNLGQDIGGTLALLPHVDFSRYDLVCKLHTKKSDWLPGRAGEQWRRDLLQACLDDPQEVFDLFERDERVTMVGSAKWIGTGTGRNPRDCLRLCDRLKLDPKHLQRPWVAGSMFWCRPFVMQTLKDARLSHLEFDTGYGRDGTLAHAVERIFGALAASRGEIRWR